MPQPSLNLNLQFCPQNAMQKVDSILEANPGISLDDLVSTRKINNDQKAQAQKKPALQAQLAQLEEQITQYKKFDQEYQHKIAQEKELLQQSHSGELEKLRGVLRDEAVLEQKKAFREKFLTLSRFLRAAAARRQLEDDDSDLTKAFEGALLLVYGGDASAVTAAEKLIDGSDDSVPSTEGVTLSVTCTF
jgi:ribosomal protein L16 Arg81 hydroxylase